ncbi:MAG: DUF4199 domain-containing protein [Bacteroidia bacterium]
MNEKQIFNKTWLKWAMILGIATFATTALVIMLDMMSEWTVTMGIALLVNIGILVLAYKEYKASNNGFMKYGRGVGMAALIGLIGGLVGGALLAFYIGIINPGVVEDIKKVQIESALEVNEKWGLGQDEDAMIQDIEERTTVSGMAIQYLWTSPLGGVFFMTLFGLIVAAIMKQNPPEDTMV